MTSISLHASSDARGIRELILYATPAGIFMAALGPFGTAAADLGTRLVYWVPLLLVAWATMAATVCKFKVAEDSVAWIWTAGRYATGILLLSLPMTLAVSLWSATIFPRVSFQPQHLSNLYRNVVVFGVMLLLLELLCRSHVRSANAPTTSALPLELASKLPPRLRDASLIALRAQDHYVEVFTTAGHEMIHARFSHLVRALRTADGAQVHRSWWVARDAVVEIRRRNGRTFLHLADQRLVPVSRSFARKLPLTDSSPAPTSSRL